MSRSKPRRVISIVCAGLAVVVSPALVGLGATTSDAAQPSARRAPAVTVVGPVAFSPNGDRRRDKARFTIRLDKRARVKLKVLGSNRAGYPVKRVGPVRLGEHRAGETLRWTWNGRDNDGNRVTAGTTYSVKVTATTHTGRVHVAFRAVEVDNVFTPRLLVAHDDTVYPRTKAVRDRLWFGLRESDDTRIDGMRSSVLRITKPGGKLVFASGKRRWRPNGGYPVAWDGRDNDGKRVPAGTYWARAHSTDAAKNSGHTRRIRVRVSDKLLAVKTGTITVAAADTNHGSHFCEGSNANGCGYFEHPCGEVVASTAYTEPGALSYRSSTACSTDPVWHYATSYHKLSVLVQTPRGQVVSKVTMRGKPTVAGESDTARLSVTHPGTTSPSATSAVTTEESLTTVTAPPVAPQTLVQAPTTEWGVTTRGDDSYDVAGFTVEYTYLAPR